MMSENLVLCLTLQAIEDAKGLLADEEYMSSPSRGTVCCCFLSFLMIHSFKIIVFRQEPQELYSLLFRTDNSMSAML